MNFDGSFELKIGPLFAPKALLLDFEVKGDRNIFINLRNIYLEVKCEIVKADNANLNYVTGDATQQVTPVFVNNTLDSLFSDCTVTAQGVKASSANGLYVHKSFIEREFSHNMEATTNPTLVCTPWQLSHREKLKKDLQPLLLSVDELPLILLVQKTSCQYSWAACILHSNMARFLLDLWWRRQRPQK